MSILRQDLEVKQKEVNAEKIEVEAILEEIKITSANVEQNQTVAVQKEKELNVESKEIEKRQIEAEEILRQAEPEIAEAEKALKVIDAAEIAAFKTNKNPTVPVKALGITILILKPFGNEDYNDEWPGVLKMVSNPGAFINCLKDFGKKIHKVTKKQMDHVKERIANKDFEFDRMEIVSKAAYNLLLWLNAMVKLYEVFKQAEPLKKKVEEMEKKAHQMNIDLRETKELVESLSKQLAEAQENQRKKQARLSELTEQATTMERRLNAAEKLLSGLGREEIRWTKDQEEISDKIICLTGDCLTTSSFLSYSGCFDFSFRQRMVYEDWRGDIAKRNIPLSEKFKVEMLLTNDVEISKWASE